MMQMCTSILVDELSAVFTINSYGPKRADNTLLRPELYGGAKTGFLDKHVYITTVERLPADVAIGRKTVIICTAGLPPKAYLDGGCTYISVLNCADLFTLFNAVQDIYNKYDLWDRQLHDILDTTSSVEELIRCSDSVIQNPIIVVDQNINVIAYSSVIDKDESLARYRPNASGKFSASTMDSYLSSYDFNMAATEPFLLTIESVNLYVVNFFSDTTYIGCIMIVYWFNKWRDCDSILGSHLAQIVEVSFKKRPSVPVRKIGFLRSVFSDLVNCYPLSDTKIGNLTNQDLRRDYFCVVLQPKKEVMTLSSEYICNVLESSFEYCVAFSYEQYIVSFMPSSMDMDAFFTRMSEIQKSLHLRAGTSDCFRNVELARAYFRQAVVALEYVSPDKEYIPYSFRSCVLHYALSHCTGEFAPETLLPDGIWRILEHDKLSETSYLETLRTYLNNNMNLSKTAKDLFIHRSTFSVRLEHIDALLQMDLKDPEQRLYLMLLLKILEYNGVPEAWLKNS